MNIIDNLLNKFEKDGVYKINVANIPFAKYVVVKTYSNNIKKKRVVETMEDVKEVVAEWNSDYGIKEENTKEPKLAKGNMNYYYYIIDSDGSVYKEGFINDLKDVGCSPKSIMNASCDSNKKLRLNIAGEFKRFAVKKVLVDKSTHIENAVNMNVKELAW